MSRFLILLATLGAILAGTATVAHAQGMNDRAQREALAVRYLDLSLGEALRDQVSTLIEAELATVGDMTSEQRAWIRASMPQMIIDMVEGMNRDLVPIYAETLTLEELQALVAFFETPLGRSIATKQVALSAPMEEVMMRHMLVFLDTLMIKYCAAFGCEDLLLPVAPAPGGAVTKGQGSRR